MNSYVQMTLSCSEKPNEIWLLDEMGGSTAIAQLTGANNATYSSVSWSYGNAFIEDYLHKTLYISGSISGMTVQNVTVGNFNTNQNWSIEWWMKCESTLTSQANDRIIFRKAQAFDVPGYSMRWAPTGGWGWMLRIHNSAASYVDIRPSGKELSFIDDRWHHWVINFSGTTTNVVNVNNVKWIIDGVQYNSSLPSFSPTSVTVAINNSYPFCIGSGTFSGLGSMPALSGVVLEALAVYASTTMSLQTAQTHFNFVSPEIMTPRVIVRTASTPNFNGGFN